MRHLIAAFGAADPASLGAFWAGLLERPVLEDAHGLLVPGEHGQLGLRFVESRAQKIGLNPMHLHLTSVDIDHQRGTVATALRLGAEHLDVGQREEEGHIVLADPEANAFCVIEPGNSFLAGCGFLGELACDGTRDVGVFWSKALEWPLVWDQDEETAIQSPDGGTKVAWGGPPVAAKEAVPRQRFDVVVSAGDHAAEVDRLVKLGATRLDLGTHGVTSLVDPDGGEFRLLTI